MLVAALKLNTGDVVMVPGYGYPFYISEIAIPHDLKNKPVSAVLHPAWKDEEGKWNAITAGFRLHTPLDEKVEKVN